MRSERILLTCVAVVLATITATSAPVHAGKRLLVLIDASASMSTPRNNTCLTPPPPGQACDRFFGAKTAAQNAIDLITSGDTSLLAAVYTFHDTATLIPATRAHGVEGFLPYNSAKDEIDELQTLADAGGSTPLAGAMCKAIDKLQSQHAMFPDDQLLLLVLSDGDENSTPLGDLCHGTPFTDPVMSDSDYPSDSWQRKVLDYQANNGKNIVPYVDLFDTSQVRLATSAEGTADPEGMRSPQARSLATLASISTGLSPLEQFFTFFTQANGGHLTIIHDDELLPVPGDMNGDRCVDHTDAILVARAFGPLVPPVDGRFDLDFNGTVDFSDYQLQLRRITTACGPDPYVPRAPLVCKDAARVVIDGQSIEDGGTTIDARGACEVIIRNSLIVSGQNAITVVGRAKLTIDDSIIVGQNAVVVQHGGGVISAANTIFHGKTSLEGSLQFTDRGGNVFE